MHDVFISYSTKNTVIADAVCNRLESGGVRCWYAPRDVQAGEGWAGQLMRAIRETKIFLLIYSEDYNRSQQVLNELTEAVDSGRTIVPFRIDQTAMNDDLAYHLKRVHWLDAVNPPTMSQIDTLYDHVSALLGREKTMPPTPPPQPPQPPAPIPRWKKLLRSIAPKWRKWLPVVLVLCVCAACVRWIPRIIDSPDPTDPPGPEYQTMSFVNLSRLPDYQNPFYSGYMLSAQGDFIALKERETGDTVIARADTGKIYLSSLDLEYEDPRQIQLGLADGYNTMYFVDHAASRITSYDRVQQDWVNRQGTYLELADTEFIAVTGFFAKSMMSENQHTEELLVFVYDAAPDVDCMSKVIYVDPEGETTVQDIYHYEIAQIIAGIDKPGGDGFLLRDRSGNLQVFDANAARLLNLSLEEILRDYLPYIHDCPAISEDDRYFFTFENDTAWVWDLHTGRKAYSRIFTRYAAVFFSGQHEIMVYNAEDESVFAYDLETEHTTVLMDQAYFQSNPVFMDEIISFSYSEEYDICVFATSDGYDEETLKGEWRIIVTDRHGTVLAASEALTTHNGSHYCQLYLLDHMLLAEMTLGDWQTAEPEDGTVTELFRALYSVDEAGNLVFE